MALIHFFIATLAAFVVAGASPTSPKSGDSVPSSLSTKKKAEPKKQSAVPTHEPSSIPTHASSSMPSKMPTHGPSNRPSKAHDYFFGPTYAPSTSPREISSPSPTPRFAFKGAVNSAVVVICPSLEYFDETQQNIFKLSLVDSVSMLTFVNQVKITTVTPVNAVSNLRQRRALLSSEINLGVAFSMEVLTNMLNSEEVRTEMKDELLTAFTGLNNTFLNAFDAESFIYFLRNEIQVNKNLTSDSIESNTVVTAFNVAGPALEPAAPPEKKSSGNNLITIMGHRLTTIHVILIGLIAVLGFLLLLATLCACRTRKQLVKHMNESASRSVDNGQSDGHAQELAAQRSAIASAFPWTADIIDPSRASAGPDVEDVELVVVNRGAAESLPVLVETSVSVHARTETIRGIIRELEQKQAAMRGNEDLHLEYRFCPTGHRLEPQLRRSGILISSIDHASPRDLETSAEDDSISTQKVHELAELMEDAGLGEFTKRLFEFGAEGVEDVSDFRLVSDADFVSKVGMTKKQIKTLRSLLNIRRDVGVVNPISRRMRRPNNEP
jgi:plasmid stabilization system protein ParE